MWKIPDSTTCSVTITVEKTHTAAAFGSGNVDVLATPMMIALMEQAARDAVQPHLPKGFTTVGTRVDVAHNGATLIGHKVTATAKLEKNDGRKLQFSVKAVDDSGQEVGSGKHSRFIIDLAKFLQKLEKNQIQTT